MTYTIQKTRKSVSFAGFRLRLVLLRGEVSVTKVLLLQPGRRISHRSGSYQLLERRTKNEVADHYLPTSASAFPWRFGKPDFQLQLFDMIWSICHLFIRSNLRNIILEEVASWKG